MIGLLILKDKWENIQTNEIDVMLQEFKFNCSNNNNGSWKERVILINSDLVYSLEAQTLMQSFKRQRLSTMRNFIFLNL